MKWSWLSSDCALLTRFLKASSNDWIFTSSNGALVGSQLGLMLAVGVVDGVQSRLRPKYPSCCDPAMSIDFDRESLIDGSEFPKFLSI